MPGPGLLMAFARRRIARRKSMDRCMDGGRVLLTVDARRLPSAATTAAKTPASATTGGVGQFSGAAWAGTFADPDKNQSSGAVEHAFESYIGTVPGWDGSMEALAGTSWCAPWRLN